MSDSSEQLPATSEEELEDLKQVNTQQADEIGQLKQQVDELQHTAKQSLTVPPDASNSQISQKTQGVKPSRDSGIGILQSAAKKAAASNSRTDVHEYMRLRRNFV
jgi:hypothetical protein